MVRVLAVLLILVALGTVGGAGSGEDGVIAVKGTEELLRLIQVDESLVEADGQTQKPVLLLGHASPVNSPESKAALETVEGLAGPLQGLVRIVSLDCDILPDDCLALGIASFPQVVLLWAGERFIYSGPLTARSLALFASNALPRNIATLRSNLVPHIIKKEARLDAYNKAITMTGKGAGSLDWWLAEELRGRIPVIFLPGGSETRLPVALVALATDLEATHAFASLISVPDALKERFRLKVEVLPAIVTGPSDGPFRQYSGEFKRAALRRFVLGGKEPLENAAPSNHAGTQSTEEAGSSASSAPHSMLEELSPAETFGLEHLTVNSQQRLCSSTCSIVLIPKETTPESLKERRRRMNLIRDIIKAIGAKSLKSPSFPKLVWASRAQEGLLQELEGAEGSPGWSEGKEVTLLVWKVKRNRVAWLAKPFAVDTAKAFLEAVLGGDAHFKPLKGTPQQLLAIPGIDQVEEAVIAEESKLPQESVPPGFVHWAYPVNTVKEKEGAVRPNVGSDDAELGASEDGIVL